MTTTLPPDLLTVPQFAERLGVCESTARKMVVTGQVPEAIKVGRQWRISKPRLERRLHGDPFSPTPAAAVSADGAPASGESQ